MQKNMVQKRIYDRKRQVGAIMTSFNVLIFDLVFQQNIRVYVWQVFSFVLQIFIIQKRYISLKPIRLQYTPIH